MMNYTLCYLENEKQEYLMLHRVKKKNDINHDPIPPPVHRHRLDWGDG